METSASECRRQPAQRPAENEMSDHRVHSALMSAAVVVLLGLADVAAGAATAPAGAPAARQRAGDPAGRTLRPRSPGDMDAKRLGKSGPDAGAWLRTLGALGVVVALIFVVRLVLKRLGRRPDVAARGEAMEVVARAPLGSRQQLALVRLGRRLVLVGTGPGGMSCLAEVTDADEVAELLTEARSKHGGGFAGVFAKYAGQTSAEAARASRADGKSKET